MVPINLIGGPIKLVGLPADKAGGLQKWQIHRGKQVSEPDQLIDFQLINQILPWSVRLRPGGEEAEPLQIEAKKPRKR